MFLKGLLLGNILTFLSSYKQMLIHIMPDLLAKAAFHQQGINPSWLTSKAQQSSWHTKGNLAYCHCSDFIVLLLQYSYWLWVDPTQFLWSVHKKKSWGIVLHLHLELDANYTTSNIKQTSQTQEKIEHTLSLLWTMFPWINYTEDTKEEGNVMTLLMWPWILCRVLSGCPFSPPGYILAWKWSKNDTTNQLIRNP